MSPTEEAAMCLWDKGIDYDDSVISRVRRAHGISDDNGGVGRGQEIDYAYEGLESASEATRI